MRVVVAVVVALPCLSVGLATLEGLLTLVADCTFSPTFGLLDTIPCGVVGLFSLAETCAGIGGFWVAVALWEF